LTNIKRDQLLTRRDRNETGLTSSSRNSTNSWQDKIETRLWTRSNANDTNFGQDPTERRL